MYKRRWSDGRHQLKSALDKLRKLSRISEDRDAQLYEAEIELMAHNRRRIRKLKRIMLMRSILDNGYLYVQTTTGSETT